MQAKERIILALDVAAEEHALALAGKLSPYVGVFKVGMELFTAAGPQVVQRIQDQGGKVFVDLKFHDIPNTVAGAARVMARLGCSMFTVHAAGGAAMLRAAVDAAWAEAGALEADVPKVLAITVLTSIDQRALETDMLVHGMSVQDAALTLAGAAKAAGVDGVVCSPHEIAAIRTACGPEFRIVTPGIRPATGAAAAAAGDQKRVMTPAEAIRLGADYLVIGRPITGAADPAGAAQAIAEDIQSALEGR